MLTIGQAAQRAGCGVETIRFYERKGLIPRPATPATGFRRYPRTTIERVRFIRQAQALGFSLREIDELLSLRADPATQCADVRGRARSKLVEVEQKIAQLERIRAVLAALIGACPDEGALSSCSILEALSGSDEGIEASRHDHDP